MIVRKIFLLLLLLSIISSIAFAKKLVVYPVVFDEDYNVLSYEALIENNINLRDIRVYTQSPVTFIAAVVDKRENIKKYDADIFWSLNKKNSYFINWQPKENSKFIDRNLLKTGTSNENRNIRVQVVQENNNYLKGKSIYKDIILKENESAVSITSIEEITENLFIYSPDVFEVEHSNNFNILFSPAPPPAFDVVMNNLSGPVIISQTESKQEIISQASYELKLNVRDGSIFNSDIIIQLPPNYYFADDFGNKISLENTNLLKYFIYSKSGSMPLIDNDIMKKIIDVRNDRIIFLNPRLLPNEYLSIIFKVSADIQNAVINKPNDKIRIVMTDYDYVDEVPVYLSTERNSLKFAQIDAYIIEQAGYNPVNTGNRIMYSLNIKNRGTDDLLISAINFLNPIDEINSIYFVEQNMSGNIINNIEYPIVIKPKTTFILNYERMAGEQSEYYNEKVKIIYDLFYRDIGQALKKISDSITKSQITFIK